MPRPRLLVDTSALYALVDASDPNHAIAKETALRLRNAEYLLLDLVWVEIVTLVKRALGPELAIQVGQELLAGPPFTFYPVKGEDFSEAWALFQRFRDKAWSFVDCAILHAAQQLNFREVFAFDRHFDQMSGLGIRRIPERRGRR
ncbi:MAG: type II toxin-antitoxin system VapC family toxin [Thermoflexus sp.]